MRAAPETRRKTRSYLGAAETNLPPRALTGVLLVRRTISRGGVVEESRAHLATARHDRGRKVNRRTGFGFDVSVAANLSHTHGAGGGTAVGQPGRWTQQPAGLRGAVHGGRGVQVPPPTSASPQSSSPLSRSPTRETWRSTFHPGGRSVQDGSMFDGSKDYTEGQASGQSSSGGGGDGDAERWRARAGGEGMDGSVFMNLASERVKRGPWPGYPVSGYLAHASERRGHPSEHTARAASPHRVRCARFGHGARVRSPSFPALAVEDPRPCRFATPSSAMESRADAYPSEAQDAAAAAVAPAVYPAGSGDHGLHGAQLLLVDPHRGDQQVCHGPFGVSLWHHADTVSLFVHRGAAGVVCARPAAVQRQTVRPAQSGQVGCGRRRLCGAHQLVAAAQLGRVLSGHESDDHPDDRVPGGGDLSQTPGERLEAGPGAGVPGGDHHHRHRLPPQLAGHAHCDGRRRGDLVLSDLVGHAAKVAQSIGTGAAVLCFAAERAVSGAVRAAVRQLAAARPRKHLHVRLFAVFAAGDRRHRRAGVFGECQHLPGDRQDQPGDLQRAGTRQNRRYHHQRLSVLRPTGQLSERFWRRVDHARGHVVHASETAKATAGTRCRNAHAGKGGAAGGSARPHRAPAADCSTGDSFLSVIVV
eukprot:ctg_1688.g454